MSRDYRSGWPQNQKQVAATRPHRAATALLWNLVASSDWTAALCRPNIENDAKNPIVFLRREGNLYLTVLVAQDDAAASGRTLSHSFGFRPPFRVCGFGVSGGQ